MMTNKGQTRKTWFPAHMQTIEGRILKKFHPVRSFSKKQRNSHSYEYTHVHADKVSVLKQHYVVFPP